MDDVAVEPADIASSIGNAVERLRPLAAAAFEADARAGLFEDGGDTDRQPTAL